MQKLVLIAAVILSVTVPIVEAYESYESENLKNIISANGTGKFNCAYKGMLASKACTVIVKKEVVKHPDFVLWYGKAAKVEVITIKWPDGDISKYTWSDSGEMINLTDKQPLGYQLAGDEVEQDWSRGFVIKKDGSEYIRIW